MARRGQEQGTQYQPVMSEASFKGYEQQSIVDKGDALKIQGQTGLIGELSRMGLDAWKGYEVAKIEKEQEGVIDDYMTQNHPVPDQSPAKPPIEQGHLDSVTKLQRAYEQGAMTPDEFQTRILSTTKDAVNRAPGFYPELIEHSKKVLELSGIAGVLKADMTAKEDASKQMETYSKNIFDAAESYNIPRDYSKASDVSYLSDLNSQINKAAERKLAADVLKDSIDGITNAKQIDVENFINSNQLPLAVRGTLENFSTQVAQAAANANTPQDYNAFVVMATSLGQTAKQQYMAGASKYVDDPRVKQQIDFLINQIDETVKTFATFKSGTEAGKFLENQKQMFANDDYMKFYETTGMSPTATTFISGLMNNQTFAAMATGGKLPIVGKVVDYLEKGINGVSKDVNTQGKPVAIDVWKGALENPTNTSATAIINNAPSVFLKETNDETKFNRGQKYSFQTDFVKSMAQPQYAESMKLMGEGGKKDALTTIKEYSTTTVGAMSKEFGQLASEGKTITLDVLPDGSLNVVGDISSEQVNKYVSRINDSINAMTNVMGGDKKTVAEKYFYPEIFKEQGATPTPVIKDQKGGLNLPQSVVDRRKVNKAMEDWFAGRVDDGFIKDIIDEMRKKRNNAN